MRMEYLKGLRNIVVKVGTSVLSKNGRFDEKAIERLSGEIATLLKSGVKISIVSSGAIGAGMTILKLKERPAQMRELQGSAAVGQRYLMQCYEKAFSKKGFSTAQVLLTWDDMANEKRYLNARHTLKQIQDWGIVPVVNENDTVATDEIRFGDNDRLSSLLSILIEADCLVILSDTNGLYAGGKERLEKNRLKIIERVDDEIFGHVQESRSALTVGGMGAKLKSVYTATASGIPVILADGREKNILGKIFKGEDVGTFFKPESRKARARSWSENFAEHVKR